VLHKLKKAVASKIIAIKPTFMLLLLLRTRFKAALPFFNL
jgi:hypothetical protein